MSGKYLIISEIPEPQKINIVKRGLIHMTQLLKRPLTEEEKAKYTKRITRKIRDGEV